MANTLTLIDFEIQKQRCLDKIYKGIYDHYKDLSKGKIKESNKDLQELVLYAKVIETWEQDKFNSINFTNYLNSNNMQYIFDRVNKLI